MGGLAKLKTEVLSYCERWKSSGKKVAEYNCPECKSKLMTILPNNKEDVWDSAAMCYECGEIHFVVKKADGVTASSVTASSLKEK